jgi:hypothetical protein
VGLKRGPLSLVSTTEELLERRKVAAPVQKVEISAVGADYATPSIRKKLTLTSPASGRGSVGIVRSRTQATEFFMYALQLACVFPQVFKLTSDDAPDEHFQL